MSNRQYLHYWAPERASDAFDGTSEPVQRVSHILYGTRKVGDVVWVISRVEDQFVMVLRAEVAKKPRVVRGRSEIELTKASQSPPRAMPLPLQTLRRLRFKNQTDMSGSLSQLLVGPLAMIRVLDPKAAPVLERLWASTPIVLWSGADGTRPKGRNREWQDLGDVQEARDPLQILPLPEEDESSFPEGAARYRLHRALERDPALVERVKRQRMNKVGALQCDVCGFDFEKVFGSHGQGFIEAHHTKPVAELGGLSKTQATDLALVCSNCHRMLHRGERLLGVDDLRSLRRISTE